MIFRKFENVLKSISDDAQSYPKGHPSNLGKGQAISFLRSLLGMPERHLGRRNLVFGFLEFHFWNSIRIFWNAISGARHNLASARLAAGARRLKPY